MDSCLFTWIFSIAVLSTLVSTDRSMVSRQAMLKLQSIQKILDGALHGDTSIYDVISEMRQQIQRLEQGQHHLKREVHNMKKTLQEVQEENYQYRDALLRAEIKMNESCCCDVDNGVRRTFMKQCERQGIKPKSDKVDNKNDIEILKLFLKTLNSTCQALSSLSCNTTSAPPTKSIPFAVTVKNRLIVTPYLKSINQLVQLDIDSNTLSKYPLGSRSVSSLCFVEKLQRLLVAQNHPRILSTTLDSNQRETIPRGVWALGMAVDDDRDLVFMSIWGRKHAISRMSTTGEDHTVVRNLSSVYRYPTGIAVNTRQREIYVNAYSMVFTLSYDGQVLQNLATGSSQNRGMTFDNVRDIVYFNKDKVLMKISLSDKGVSEVITLPVKPFSLNFYNDTLYYGGMNATGYIGAVQVGKNVGTTELMTFSWEYDRDLVICLVP